MSHKSHTRLGGVLILILGLGGLIIPGARAGCCHWPLSCGSCNYDNCGITCAGCDCNCCGPAPPPPPPPPPPTRPGNSDIGCDMTTGSLTVGCNADVPVMNRMLGTGFTDEQDNNGDGNICFVGCSAVDGPEVNALNRALSSTPGITAFTCGSGSNPFSDVMTIHGCGARFIGVSNASKPKLQIIIAGLPKTATTSLSSALMLLGRPVCHDTCTSANPNSENLKLWEDTGDIAPRVDEILNQKLGEVYADVPDFTNTSSPVYKYRDLTFVGVGDVPFCYKLKELLEINPDAKVILSVHPGGPEGWLSSALEYSSDLRTPIGQTVLNAHIYPSLHQKFMLEENQKALAPCNLLAPEIDESMREICKKRYEDWEDEVRSVVPPANFLRFNASDGWDPLLSFFGAESPGVPFPQQNTETEEMHMLTDGLKKSQES